MSYCGNNREQRVPKDLEKEIILDLSVWRLRGTALRELERISIDARRAVISGRQVEGHRRRRAVVRQKRIVIMTLFFYERIKQ